MKALESAPSPGPRSERPAQAPGDGESADDFPICLAEAIEILANRAKRHGLVEAAHLLEVAALAARDSAMALPSGTSRSAPKRDCFPSSPA